MLQFSLVQAPLRFGLAEGTDPRLVPFGTLLTAENCIWEKQGRIAKRLGSTALTSSIVGGGTITAGARLGVRAGELWLTTGSTLYSYTSSGWVSRGAHPELGLEWHTATDTSTGVQCADLVALTNGQVVEAWVSGDPSPTAKVTGTLYYQVRDPVSRTIITPPTQVSVGVAPNMRLVASGNTWALFYLVSGNLVVQLAASNTTLKTDAVNSATAVLDAYTQGTDFVVAYALAAGGIRLVRYDAATISQQATDTVTGEASTGYGSISVGGASGETLYIAYFDGTNTRIRFAAANPSTLAQTVAPVNVESVATMTAGTVGLVRQNSTNCLLVYSFVTGANTTAQAGVTRNVTIRNDGVINGGQSTWFMRPLSRPFAVGSSFFCFLATDAIAPAASVTSSDTFLVDVTRVSNSEPFRQVGKVDVLIGGCWARGHVQTPMTFSTGVIAALLPWQSTPPTGIIGVRQGLRHVRVTSGAALPADMWRSVEVMGESAIVGGVLGSYDGVDCIGWGWPHGPYFDLSNFATSGAGGSIGAGTYIYNVTAERRRASGLLHRSPVGIPVTVTLGGATSKTTIAVLGASLGRSSKNYGEFVFFRTVAGGTIPQRISLEPANALIVDNASLTYPATVNDTQSDTGIAGLLNLSARPPIYTAGGELEDTQPVAFVTECVHRNRIFGVAGDRRTVWLSKDFTANGPIAPGFHPSMTMTFAEDLTAVASLDDKLIAFSSQRPYYVIGDGPAPNGLGSDYAAPTPIVSDVGCSNPRSVVQIPSGILFQSSRGIYLLSRALQTGWIGRPIKDQLAAFPNITSAVLVPTRSEVRFTANNVAGTAGIVLVYNYVEDQWTTSRYTVAGVYGPPIADATLWNGTWTFVTTSGVVVTENASSYLDGSTWVPMTIETAWVAANGPLTFQSVRRFALEGESLSNHDLTISVGFERELAYSQSAPFVAGSPVTAIGPLEQAEITIGTRRKCQAIRFKVADATPTNPGTYPVGTGQGPSFTAVGINVGIKSGFANKPATKMG